MKILNVLCDMDGIIVDLSRYWLTLIERDFGVKCSQDEIDKWDMAKCGALQTLTPKQVYGYLQQPGFFRAAPPIPGSLEALKQIVDDGHRVSIISTAQWGPHGAKEKMEWLEEHTPFLNRKNVIFVFDSAQKQFVAGDVLIDDHPDTLQQWAQRHGDGLGKHGVGLGIRYPYNAHLQGRDLKTGNRFWTPGVFLYDDFNNPVGAWQQIVNEVRDTAEGPEGTY
jgi:5'-nucleotidase